MTTDTKNSLKWFSIAILLFLALFLLKYRISSEDGIIEEEEVRYIYLTDTQYLNVEVMVPKPYKIIESVHDTVWRDLDVDTISIMESVLGECWKTKYYIDTIIDSNMAAIVGETVQGNSIIDRSFNYVILRERQVTVTNTVETKAPNFYAAPLISMKTDKIGLGVSALYVGQGDVMYGAGYDFINRNLYFNLYYPIHFKK